MPGAVMLSAIMLSVRRLDPTCGEFHKHFTRVIYSCSKISYTVQTMCACNIGHIFKIHYLIFLQP
jgi:hypothetical protein